MNNVLAVIAAAGEGKRFGGNTPKQYIKLNGKTVIESSVKPFIDSEIITKIIIVVSKNDLEIENQDFYSSKKVEVIYGGDKRQISIFNALQHEDDNYEFVITHDAARPNIDEDIIFKLYEDIIKSQSSCSYLYTPVYESIRGIDEQDKTLDKNKFYLVQTPQISNFNDLKKSIKKCLDEDIESPDESSAIEYSNLKLSKVKGTRSNIKVTEKEDVKILNKFLTRSGTGFDLHKYESGNGIVLGGCKIECNYKIIAHSDGDVLLHSIADSILGAAGIGDIGMFFSDKDNANKGLDSSQIIEYCLDELKKLNLEIYNIDTTIICENPKINPFRDQILKKMSLLLQVPTSRIGLKATTSEKLGIIGNNQAIAVQSLVNLKDKV